MADADMVQYMLGMVASQMQTPVSWMLGAELRRHHTGWIALNQFAFRQFALQCYVMDGIHFA